MIAVQLEGRLGNQLFQYAFIYAASKRLKTTFYIDKSVENFLLPKYFEIQTDGLKPLDDYIFSIEGYKNIFNVHAKKAFYHFINHIVFWGNRIVIDNDTTAAVGLKMVKNNYLYNGFFHSQGFFDDFKEDIRSQFKIKNVHTLAYEQIECQFPASKKKVVIHVRRTDYVDLNLSLPLSYYKEAIASIGDENLTYIFISDDPHFVEKEFDFIPDKYVSTQNEITDLQFLINADICILSNSSFSWWGAWLNNKQHKQVFAPKFWFGFRDGKESPVGVSDHVNINWIVV
jgi:hypothetical protein